MEKLRGVIDVEQEKGKIVTPDDGGLIHVKKEEMLIPDKITAVDIKQEEEPKIFYGDLTHVKLETEKMLSPESAGPTGMEVLDEIVEGPSKTMEKKRKLEDGDRSTYEPTQLKKQKTSSKGSLESHIRAKFALAVQEKMRISQNEKIQTNNKKFQIKILHYEKKRLSPPKSIHEEYENEQEQAVFTEKLIKKEFALKEQVMRQELVLKEELLRQELVLKEELLRQELVLKEELLRQELFLKEQSMKEELSLRLTLLGYN